MTTLLKEKAEERMVTFESRKRRERCLDIAEIALADGGEIQHVAILGHLLRQCRADSKSRSVVLRLHELANPLNLAFNERSIGVEGRRTHLAKITGNPVTRL